MTTTVAHEALLPTYARYDVTFVRGEGSWLVDDGGGCMQGRPYGGSERRLLSLYGLPDGSGGF